MLMRRQLINVLFLVCLLVLVDSFHCVYAQAKSGTRIAWGGVGRFGFGGFGYGRLIRLGTRSLYRGRRRGRWGYGSRRRRGEFSYNHSRINRGMGNGYLNPSQGYGYGRNNSQLWGRAQGRFDRRHTNNELWNRGGMGASQESFGAGGNMGATRL